MGVKVEDVETLKNTPGAPENTSGSVIDEHFYPNRKNTSASDNARLRSSAAIFPPGILLRSSVWLALPNLMDSISAANGTAAWPEVYCVGSAVRTGACSGGPGWPWWAPAPHLKVLSCTRTTCRDLGHRTATVRVAAEQIVFRAADVDPAVFQRLFLVDLFLRRGRFPGGENISRNQVSRASVYHSSFILHT